MARQTTFNPGAAILVISNLRRKDEGTMFNVMILKLFALYKDEEGQALPEYGLILGLIAVVAVAALAPLGAGITGQPSGPRRAPGGGGPPQTLPANRVAAQRATDTSLAG